MSEKTEKKVRGKNGGKRPGSGRKPHLLEKAELERVKTLIAQHGVQIDSTDKNKRLRILRLLDILYEQGSKKKDVRAIKEYLDRQLGKSKEHVELEGDLPFSLTIVQKK